MPNMNALTLTVWDKKIFKNTLFHFFPKKQSKYFVPQNSGEKFIWSGAKQWVGWGKQQTKIFSRFALFAPCFQMLPFLRMHTKIDLQK